MAGVITEGTLSGILLRGAIAYVGTAVVFLLMDAVYLRFIGGALYRAALGDYLVEPVRVGPAVAFYIIYVLGLVYFAVLPAIATGEWSGALWRGAALGFLAYATYELTNYATLARWTPALVAADMVWGTIVSAAGATAGYAALRVFLR